MNERRRPIRPRPASTASVHLLVACAVVGAALGAFAASPTAVAAPSPCGTTGVLDAATSTCTYTTVGTDTFTVPAGVSSASVDLFGGAGGSSPGYLGVKGQPVPPPPEPNPLAPGGLGGETRGTLAVTPGAVLQITVGGLGASGTARHGAFAFAGAAGDGPGGGGSHGGGGAGGGGSSVRVGAFAAADLVLVAGGGGGAGNGGPGLVGGAGGGLSGASGAAGAAAGAPDQSGGPGGGGTQTEEGAGGSRGGVSDATVGGPGGTTEMPGAGGPGGNGGGGGFGGGGGGGGYLGGGGGGGGGAEIPDGPSLFWGGGGGGGSGYADPGATDTMLISGVNRGAGMVVVRFGALAPAATTTMLGVTPVSPVAAGTGEMLSATINPAAAGTVQFMDGSTPLGAPVAVTGGTASLPTTLSSGTHSLSAGFTPTDQTALTGYSGSTSATLPYTVNAKRPLCIRICS